MNRFPRRNFTGPFEKTVFERIEKASEKNQANDQNWRLMGIFLLHLFYLLKIGGGSGSISALFIVTPSWPRKLHFCYCRLLLQKFTID